LNESVVSAASALNRLAASNGEITITTTHGPGGVGVKASPSSMHSPKEEEDDLLNDSPSKAALYIRFRRQRGEVTLIEGRGSFRRRRPIDLRGEPFRSGDADAKTPRNKSSRG